MNALTPDLTLIGDRDALYEVWAILDHQKVLEPVTRALMDALAKEM